MHMQSLLLSAAAAALCVAASSDPTLTQLIASNDNLSTLGSLLKRYPAIDKALASAGKVTLFAPDNDAIQTWMNTAIGSSTSSAEDGIQSVLEYHVLSSVVYSSDVMQTPAFPTTLLKTGNGEYQVVEASLDDGSVIITTGLEEKSKVIQANLNFTDGVVHVIDKVLTVPPNVLAVGLIGGLEDFIGASFKAGLATKLQSATNYTFFAPNNEAFQAIGSAASKLSMQELAEVLEYHVLKSAVYSSDLKDESVATLNGKDIKITVEKGGAVFVNAARIVNANILVDEGVLHVIDSVLNPSNSSAKPDPSASSPAVQFSGASSAGLAALTSTLPPASTYASALAATRASVAAMPSGGGSSAGGSSGTTSTTASGGSSTTSGSGGTMAPTASAASGTSATAATGGAAIPTAAVGALALFGGAALLGNW